MATQTRKVSIRGTGFVGNFTVQIYSMIPPHNEVNIRLPNVTSAHPATAERFAKRRQVGQAFVDIRKYTQERNFAPESHPNPASFGEVLQRP